MSEGCPWGVLAALILIGAKPVEPINHAHGDKAKAGINAEKPAENSEAARIRSAFEAQYRQQEAADNHRRAEADLEAQQTMAKWTRLMGIAAVLGVGLSIVGVYLIWRTWHATRGAADTSRKTYDAFIAAEDASLVVEFPEGHIYESVVDGVAQPDSYFLRVKVTNIGRSTARIHGWQIGDKKHREDRTLKPDETVSMHDIEVIEPANAFTLTVNYSSPLRDRMLLDVHAILRVKKGRGNPVHARVISVGLRNSNDRQEQG